MSSNHDSQPPKIVSSRNSAQSRPSRLGRPPTSSSSPSPGASNIQSPITLDEDDIDEHSSSVSDSRKRKWNSPVWAHYDITEGETFPDGVPRAVYLDEEMVDFKVKNVKDKLYKFFSEYAKETSQVNVTNVTEKGDDDLNGFSTSDDFVQSDKSELDIYLANYMLDYKLELDVLEWWKENERRFPTVAKMARDLFAIPITTVASESAFSMGGRVLTKWRTSLNPETAEALLTTRSWLFGLKLPEDESQENEGLDIQISNNTINLDAEKTTDV